MDEDSLRCAGRDSRAVQQLAHDLQPADAGHNSSRAARRFQPVGVPGLKNEQAASIALVNDMGRVNISNSYSRGIASPALPPAARNQLNRPAAVCAGSAAPASQGSTAAACVACRITSRHSATDPATTSASPPPPPLAPSVARARSAARRQRAGAMRGSRCCAGVCGCGRCEAGCEPPPPLTSCTSAVAAASWHLAQTATAGCQRPKIVQMRKAWRGDKRLASGR